MYRQRAARFRDRLNGGDSRGEFIAIGIDFGTTFSGVSWAFSEQPNMIHEISKWPAANPSDSIEIQVPTVYDIDSGKWGYQVTRDMEPVKWFKWLLLSDEDLAMEEISRSKQLREARNQLSNHPTQLTATHLVGRYLEKLWDHTCAMVKTMMPIDDFPLRVAITIPANWPDYAQNAMREAAQLAGITTKRPIWASTLDLVQESIAASLPIIQEHSLLAEVKPGECFVVCDAGGGTVDVISFKFVLNNPSRIKERVEGVSNKSSRLEECVEGEGGLCGAVQIDEAFEAHLLGKSRLKIDSLNASEYNTLVVEGWERGVKRTFTNAKTPTEFSLRLPMKAFKTRDKLHKRDHFSVNRSEVYGFFSKSLTGIRTLISNQREQVKKETGKFPKNILLVGGLGSSLHVYNELNQVFDGTVLRALNGWSAVAQGAVIQVLLDNLSLRAIYDAKQRKELPRTAITEAKQSQTSPFRQAYGSNAGSTVSNQDNRQEKEHEHEPEGGRPSVPNDSNQIAIARQVEQNALKETIIEQKKLIMCLRKDLCNMENDLVTAQQQHDKEVAELKKTLAALRNKGMENATRSAAEIPLQLPLHCPEGEILRAWNNLTEDVGCLISIHFRESEGRKAVAWAERRKVYLINLTPHYKDVMEEKKTAAAFIEAAIWNVLCMCVFGPYRNNAPFCWAGKYKGSLRTMSNFLLADVDNLETNKHRHKAMFHQWKALTANLVTTMVPQERHNDEKAEIAEDLGDLLDGLPSSRPSQECITDLRAIADKAVDLSMRLCGQKRWYCVDWHPENCHQVPLNEARMELKDGSPRSKNVRFMVRPGIYGSQGEDYENMWVLERCRVWAF